MNQNIFQPLSQITPFVVETYINKSSKLIFQEQSFLFEFFRLSKPKVFFSII